MTDVTLGLLEAARERARDTGLDRSSARITADLGLTGRREREREVGAEAASRACCAYEREALLAGAVPADQDRWDWLGDMTASTARDLMVRQYSWAIPGAAALDTIGAYGPVVEVGAGGGYWAMLLAERGVRIAPFDLHPEPYVNHMARRCWHPVARGDASRALRMYPERTLLLCWPPYDDAMAERALALHRGEWVAYVGEGPWGCTGTDGFHEALKERYELAEDVPIPQWYGMHDSLEMWRQKTP